MDEEMHTGNQPAPSTEHPVAIVAESAPSLDSPVTVVDVHFKPGGKNYFFDPGKLSLKAGDHVIIETTQGMEFGYCGSDPHVVRERDVIRPLRCVLRIATEHDEKILAELKEREKRAYGICQEKITALGLDMQLVSAECAFDGSKILFFFTADGRVDFRELVKTLASIFRTRIELRQIGVRDKAKMVGGLGACGRPFCCTTFLSDFQPVSIKMAKTQNLSLNPTKISGTCGRLMCCLKYEQDAYESLLKSAPKNDSFVDTPDGRGTVTDVSLLRQTVKVRMEDAPDTIRTYSNEDIYIIRNGKAKKTDPPIPKDFAPISSQPHPRTPAKAPEPEMPVEPIILSAMPDPAVPVPSGPQADAELGKDSASHRRRRHRGSRKPGDSPREKQLQPDAEKPQENRDRKPRTGNRPKQPAPQQPVAAENGSQKKPNNRRRNYHRRRSSGGNSSTPKSEA